MPHAASATAALTFLILACSLPQLMGGIGTAAPPVEGALPLQPLSEEFEDLSMHAGRGVRGPWFEAYFTAPQAPASSQYTGGLDGPLVTAIDDARLSVHVAVFSLSLNYVRDALIRAHRRGVDVRVVMESDNIEADDPQRLKQAGIPLLGDRRQGLMHDKFLVIDGIEVWTGSMNYTVSGAYSDDNNLIRIDSAELAEDFETEFEEMFTDDHFGPDTGRPTPKPSLVIQGTPVEVYFSPDDHVRAALLSQLTAARSSIYFLAFSFTSNELGSALLRARTAGIQVSGVMDADQAASNVGSEWDAFRHAGLDVRLDGNAGQMHDKILIIDGKVVMIGSYNFTNSAETANDENLLVIHSPEIAAEYMQEFQRIYALAQP